MSKRNEIRSVEMGPHIRDDVAASLEGKSHAKIIALFRDEDRISKFLLDGHILRKGSCFRDRKPILTQSLDMHFDGLVHILLCFITGSSCRHTAG